MKSMVYWLMGDHAGRVMVASWNWAWGKPVAQGGKIAVEVAQESIRSMQASIAQLTDSVAKAMAAYEQVKQQHESKKCYAINLESQAAQALKQGQENQAQTMMGRAIEIEKILPVLESQVQKAGEAVESLKTRLEKERNKLGSFQIQMQNLQSLAEVNEALSIITNLTSGLEIDSARHQFQEAQAAIVNRNVYANAYQELSENPVEKIQEQIEETMMEDEVKKRLLQLGAFPEEQFDF
jgi:phage shock protein A